MRFTFVQTADDSPTLRVGTEEPFSEAMHSLKGAFSETVYIYGTAIDRAYGLSRSEPLESPARILSMGLGLGYVEILSAALATETAWKKKNDKFKTEFSGESFEILPELRDYFLSWVFDREMPESFRNAYGSILERSANQTHQDAKEIKAVLRSAIEEGRWLLREELTATTRFEYRFGCICFDAFSSKSTPELWTDEFLLDFLDRAAADACVLSTYACTGSLKRALRACGFEVQIREGFSSKRDSTFAVRDGERTKNPVSN